MNTLFAQSVAQFATLRVFARLLRNNRAPAQLIRELFPKALFNERDASYPLLAEIAWSFLSQPLIVATQSEWYKARDMHHRIGGLPATIGSQYYRWYYNGINHRGDKDPRTGLTLPAVIWSDTRDYQWKTNGKMTRNDKDPRTGLTLPAEMTGDRAFVWWKNDRMMRDDRDPITGVVLPDYVDLDT